LDIQQKLMILADSAKYDVSCASSGTFRQGRANTLGNATYSGICHSFAADGRCISLLKILMTNICIYDCRYCINRRSNDIRRTLFTPAEIADLTIGFYRRNYIEGLFLSSGIVKSPNDTMELFIHTLKLLRHRYRFNGYIHVKIIPGASAELVHQIGFLADRLSVNIELPSRQSLAKLAPDKTKESIIVPMRQMAGEIEMYKMEKKKYRHSPNFSPSGQSTQMIIAATPESDYDILRLSEHLYRKMNLKRVYYSAYVAVNHDALLPANPRPQLIREHRLYQADWLLRFYGYQSHEIVSESHPQLSENYDPKVNWALHHLDFFPIEIHSADYEDLLRVPGIGMRSAQKIVFHRRAANLSRQDLRRLGIVYKRAQHFITINGRFEGGQSSLLHSLLSERKIERARQLHFDFNDAPSAVQPSITGEL